MPAPTPPRAGTSANIPPQQSRTLLSRPLDSPAANTANAPSATPTPTTPIVPRTPTSEPQ
eukprot:scaffold2224_cov107-Isochrysis_galbana.AAC.2